jgi:hypothetical protein
LAKHYIVPQPLAEVTPIEAQPVRLFDGSTHQHFETRFGARYLKVVHPSRQVVWYKETKDA